ncbi:unnamed protein product [Penicillium salamii]|uniref:Uncharacterized protein n=1 Tax=Penicillium salamii TaxID=1612424 RepID=A0A9W4J3L5_9EURO|nr:unnamed protein product [Penicillium salamii]CAG8084778.1 unnamed protein product [Penicillium salamii]CAG8241014.1 unnamed protein product [Penicillium salamii]CAG8244252.1 unnamed protein product [Penicillium salamii]CAG8268101.1 unnamed protein product [Penicillium salamii]
MESRANDMTSGGEVLGMSGDESPIGSSCGRGQIHILIDSYIDNTCHSRHSSGRSCKGRCLVDVLGSHIFPVGELTDNSGMSMYREIWYDLTSG